MPKALPASAASPVGTFPPPDPVPAPDRAANIMPLSPNESGGMSRTVESYLVGIKKAMTVLIISALTATLYKSARRSQMSVNISTVSNESVAVRSATSAADSKLFARDRSSGSTIASSSRTTTLCLRLSIILSRPIHLRALVGPENTPCPECNWLELRDGHVPILPTRRAPLNSDAAHCKNGSMQQYRQIHKEVAVADIVEIVLNVFVYEKGSVPTQLPQTRYSRLHLQSLPLGWSILLHDKRHLGPWA